MTCCGDLWSTYDDYVDGFLDQQCSYWGDDMESHLTDEEFKEYIKYCKAKERGE